jgi:hypothetical protein
MPLQDASITVSINKAAADQGIFNNDFMFKALKVKVKIQTPCHLLTFIGLAPILE